MKRICVFCGSSMGTRPAYAKAAVNLGKMLADSDIELVYGGGNVGLMGVVANACMAAGGKVTGIIPKALMELEVGHINLTQLHVVNDMHERKAMMAQLSDAFIALPGGIGTMEEMFEVWTWGQLGFHKKPVGVLDVAGYYSHLHHFLDQMVSEGFLKERHRKMVAVEEDAAALLERLRQYQPPSQATLADVR